MFIRSGAPTARQLEGAKPLAGRHRSPFLALAVAVVFSGCGGTALDRGAVLNNVGRGTASDIHLSVPEILNKAGYAIRTYRETRNGVYYETEWLRREPFEDEAAEGAERCRTRIIVEARKSAGRLFAVRLRAENRAQRDSPSAQWDPMVPTPMFRDHVREISTAIAMDIDSGVRIW